MRCPDCNAYCTRDKIGDVCVFWHCPECGWCEEEMPSPQETERGLTMPEPTIPDILANREKYVVVFHEPVPGVFIDGHECDCDQECRISVDSAIQRQRIGYIDAPAAVDASEAELLTDFIDINWAKVVPRPPKLYRIIAPLVEGEPTQYLGVYILNWRREWGEPTVGFVEVDE